VVPWLVHLLTASGVLLAWWALEATIRSDYRLAFTWLGIATVIDAVDGWLARLARVKERIPAIDGARLDDIVDYLTFVFVPACIVGRSGLVPTPWIPLIVALILLSSAYGFSQTNAKTTDYFFTGFPSYWNIVVLYLWVLDWPPLVNGLVLIWLSAAVFYPIGYVYPSRTPILRTTTIVLASLWAVACAVIIWQLPDPPRVLVQTSVLFPIYYFVLSVALHRRRGPLESKPF
jgi:phosphatidylcholine synthase